MTIDCDTSIVIYLLDNTGPWHQKAKDRLDEMTRVGERVATSDLVRLECRVQPIRRGDLTVLADFDTYFASHDLIWTPVTPAVFDRATELRAYLRFKTRDAIHLAAAIEAGCDAFLTNDTRLATCTAIPIEVLS